MANYTANYGLHQWEPGDYFLRTDFNEDFKKIDQALGAVQSTKCEVVIGTYTGNGAARRTISLGFTPRAVLVESADGRRTTNSGANGGLILNGHALIVGGVTAAEIVSGGFAVTYVQYSANLNANGDVFSYVAFK